MIEVIGVSFDDGNRIYYFDSNNIVAKVDDYIIVETERGLQYGKVLVSNIEKKEENLNLPLKKAIRLSNKEDGLKRWRIELNKTAFILCEKGLIISKSCWRKEGSFIIVKPNEINVDRVIWPSRGTISLSMVIEDGMKWWRISVTNDCSW